jgi:hypothetical protein
VDMITADEVETWKAAMHKTLAFLSFGGKK